MSQLYVVYRYSASEGILFSNYAGSTSSSLGPVRDGCRAAAYIECRGTAVAGP